MVIFTFPKPHSFFYFRIDKPPKDKGVSHLLGKSNLAGEAALK